MEFKEYVHLKKHIYDYMIKYLSNKSESGHLFQDLTNQINVLQYQKDKSEFKLILTLINKVSKNIHRFPLFLDKIKRFLSFYEEYIIQTFTNQEIYNIYKNNKRILLLLIEMRILTIDQIITKLMLKKIYDLDGFYSRVKGSYGEIDSSKCEYFHEKLSSYLSFLSYFYPEIKQFLTKYELTKIEKEMKKQNESIMNDFDKNRKIGENESYICQLIRQDLIEKFVSYVNRYNISVSTQILPSIFETNRFLCKRKPTLIEYAAFYGSIQIFKYLRLNHAELLPSLWLYAIHGKNPEIIHLLEQDQIMPEDKSYLECFEESIKCHHNDIADYIYDNLINQDAANNEDDYKKNKIAFGFRYHNYKYFKKNVSNSQFILYYASTNDYLTIVKILINSGKVDINKSII